MVCSRVGFFLRETRSYCSLHEKTNWTGDCALLFLLADARNGIAQISCLELKSNASAQTSLSLSRSNVGVIHHIHFIHIHLIPFILISNGKVLIFWSFLCRNESFVALPRQWYGWIMIHG